MQHIEEHILELFVLQAKEVQDRREDIQDHLNRCHGCRTLAEAIASFYHDAETELMSEPQVPQRTEQKPLVKVNSALARLYGEDRVALYCPPLTPAQRFRGFARRHPVVMGGGSFAVVAAIAATLTLLATSSPRDKNPSYVHLNPTQNTFEVYNRNDEKLWQLPVKNGTYFFEDEAYRRISYSQVADLDGDGKNEIITAVQGLGTESERRDVLRIFGSDKKILREIRLGEQVHFLGVTYADYFQAKGGLLVDDFSGKGRREIISVAVNIHSPCVISRFDADGKLIGEYWHFGYFGSIYSLDLDGDGKKEIVCCGTNDANGDMTKRFGVIVVLEPSMIQGKIESACTSGFGFAATGAELYYLRLPQTDMQQDQDVGVVQNMLTTRYENEDIMSFWYVAGGTGATLEYIFSKQMRVLDVKTSTAFEDLHARLAKEGEVTAKIDKEYLEKLKTGVRYWDGKEWRKGVVRVEHGKGD